MRSIKYRAISVFILYILAHLFGFNLSFDTGIRPYSVLFNHVVIFFVGRYIGNMIFHYRNGIIIDELKILDNHDGFCRFYLKFSIYPGGTYEAQGSFYYKNDITVKILYNILFTKTYKRDFNELIEQNVKTIDYEISNEGKLSVIFNIL